MSMSDTTSTYEPVSLPDDAYRSALLALLAAQAVPVWGIGQQQAYEDFVMEGASLEHWVRMSGMWAEVERNVWQLNTLLGRLGIDAVEDLSSSLPVKSRQLVEEATENWVDLLFTEVVVDNLGTAMIRACEHSSYAPLTRIARLLIFSKVGAFASGVLGIREAVARGQVPAAVLRERASRWLEVGATLAEQIDQAQQEAGWVAFGLAGSVDTRAALSDAEANINELLEAVR
jgi:hypothetical protein